MRLDVFCHIVDNYGDAGVCWRLTRRLAQLQATGKYDSIRLFCDELTLLNFLAGGNALQVAKSSGFEIHPWSDAAKKAQEACPDAVLETFSCDLPKEYLKIIRQHPHCQWINIEYLSAEPWIDSHHGMASSGTTPPRYFFFPGFTHASGSILKGPFAWSIAESLKNTWQHRRQEALAMSLFCYDTEKIQVMLNCLTSKSIPIDVLVCFGQAQASAGSFLKVPFEPGSVIDHHGIRFIGLPFVSQEDYDSLLANCDLNIVRGEDSFVRAQWASKPFIWDIYPQSENAHQIKLEAFIKRYGAALSPPDLATLKSLMNFDLSDLSKQNLEKLKICAKNWTSHLEELTADGDLAEKLVDFIEERLKSVKI